MTNAHTKPRIAFSRRAVLAGGIAAAAVFTLPARAAQIPFDEAWRHLTFRTLAPNSFTPLQGELGVVADASSSIYYRILPSTFHDASRAEWRWNVTRSVPPSDLSQIGNDDRNLGVFFVSADASTAARLAPDASIGRLMTNRSARILMYTWGGSSGPGTIVPSPHAPGRMRNLVMREAGTGAFSESVDLNADFERVFGQPLEKLVAVAVSSNSENTPGRVEATVSQLSVE